MICTCWPGVICITGMLCMVCTMLAGWNLYGTRNRDHMRRVGHLYYLLLVVALALSIATVPSTTTVDI